MSPKHHSALSASKFIQLVEFHFGFGPLLSTSVHFTSLQPLVTVKQQHLVQNRTSTAGVELEISKGCFHCLRFSLVWTPCLPHPS